MSDGIIGYCYWDACQTCVHYLHHEQLGCDVDDAVDSHVHLDDGNYVVCDLYEEAKSDDE